MVNQTSRKKCIIHSWIILPQMRIICKERFENVLEGIAGRFSMLKCNPIRISIKESSQMFITFGYTTYYTRDTIC